MKRYLPFAIIAIVLFSAIVVAALLLRTPRQSSSSLSPGQSSTSKTTGPQPGADPPNSKGNPNAPVTIEEFGDLQCPPCAAMHPELQKIQQEYGERVRVIFRHFPLTQMHPYALEAAQAVEAAGMQGKFWEMHDWMYLQQEKWTQAPNARQMFLQQAQNLGLNVEKFRQDMNSAEVKQRIILDYNRGMSLGVTGTPTLFINGKQVTSDKMTDEGIHALINSALAAKGQ
ncbi:MAG TPA: thioredoxin domain-containing protein [Pyrinomonadaceae bacterium]|nr:thioredoxin domain-containing protein [Pyrinomonadaceae bacterium]